MKKWLKVGLSVLVAFSLTACGSGSKKAESGTTDTKADKGLEVIGENITYDPNKLVNEGKPITIEYWTWGDNDYTVEMAKKYQEIYPNVTIKTKLVSWDDYWTKLPLALKGKEGPTIFNIHNSQDKLVKPYLAAYEIETADLEADYNGVAAHIADDGKVYYTDYAMMSGNIFYNKDLWQEAGLTEADIPKTWEAFREVAKKLTKADNGKITQAGFNWNGDYSALYEGLNYQLGELLFAEDGTTVNYDNPATKKNLQYLVDLYNVDKVGSPDFGDDSSMSFGNGQSGMVYKWGHYETELKEKYPDVNFGVFQLPTWTEEVPFAYDRYNGESTFGINKGQTAEKQAVAQDFLRYLLAGEDYTKNFSAAVGAFPMKKSLADDASILESPVLSALSSRVDRLIWPGPFPSTLETTGKQVAENVLYNGIAIDQAVKEGQAQMEKDLSSADFVSLEGTYTHFADLKK